MVATMDFLDCISVQSNNKKGKPMSKKEAKSAVEVAEKFMVKERYGHEQFETFAEAEEAAQKEAFRSGEATLVYQAVAKAQPNTADVKVEKLT